MSEQNTVLGCANKLEGLLRKYLGCGYGEFGVKANNNLTQGDWKSPINFALGHRYASSNNDSNVKKDIEFFLGNELEGQSIGDIIERHEYYGFNTEAEAYASINKTIENLRKILYSD